MTQLVVELGLEPTSWGAKTWAHRLAPGAHLYSPSLAGLHTFMKDHKALKAETMFFPLPEHSVSPS